MSISYYEESFIEAHKAFYDTGFIWVSDQERLNQLDRWQVLTANPYYRGDCEDAGLTIMNDCLEQGIPFHKLFILRCATEVCDANKAFDHAVLGLLTKQQGFLVSDNRYQNYPAVPTNELKGYRWFDAVSIENLQGTGVPKRLKTVGDTYGPFSTD